MIGDLYWWKGLVITTKFCHLRASVGAIGVELDSLPRPTLPVQEGL